MHVCLAAQHARESCQLVPTDEPENRAQQLSALYLNALVKLCAALLW